MAKFLSLKEDTLKKLVERMAEKHLKDEKQKEIDQINKQNQGFSIKNYQQLLE